jgi:hypothetical protein
MSTIKVKLAHDWFAPLASVQVGKGGTPLTRGGQLFRGPKGKEGGIHDFPESYRGILPKSAKILSDAEAAKATEKKPEDELKSFKDMDPQRAAMEIVADKLAGAELEGVSDLSQGDDPDYDPELAAKADKFREEMEAEKKQRQRDAMAKARAARGKNKG